MVVAPAQVGTVAGRAILHRLAVVHGVPVAAFVGVVLDAAAILPILLGMSFQAGRLAVVAAPQIDPMAC
jgi:hypothetical protein